MESAESVLGTQWAPVKGTPRLADLCSERVGGDSRTLCRRQAAG